MRFYNALISIYHLLTKFYPNSYQIFVKFYFGKRWSNVKKNLKKSKSGLNVIDGFY